MRIEHARKRASVRVKRVTEVNHELTPADADPRDIYLAAVGAVRAGLFDDALPWVHIATLRADCER